MSLVDDGRGPAQQVGLGQQAQLERVDSTKPRPTAAVVTSMMPGSRRLVQASTRAAGMLALVEQLGQPLGRAGAVGDHHDPPLVPHAGADELQHLRHVALVAARFAGLQVHHVDLRQELVVRAAR